jgi:hypothetical protein
MHAHEFLLLKTRFGLVASSGSAEPPPRRLLPNPYAPGMCRNIRTLYNFEPAASDDEIRAAALQYVRKVTGYSKPSQANEAAFEQAVDEVAHVTHHLLEALVTTAPPRDREVEAARARARAAERFGTAA